MPEAKTISITLAPELLAEAQRLAEREHRTISDLVGDALRTHVDANTKARLDSWNAFLERTHAHGRAMGITSEEDVDRILGEFRTPGLG